MTAIKADLHSATPATKDPDEVLRGAEAIGAELGLTARQAFYHLEHGNIRGVRKLGRMWIGTRRNIREATLEVPPETYAESKQRTVAQEGEAA
jgi:hypothetical protein